MYVLLFLQVSVSVVVSAAKSMWCYILMSVIDWKKKTNLIFVQTCLHFHYVHDYWLSIAEPKVNKGFNFLYYHFVAHCIKTVNKLLLSFTYFFIHISRTKWNNPFSAINFSYKLCPCAIDFHSVAVSVPNVNPVEDSDQKHWQ